MKTVHAGKALVIAEKPSVAGDLLSAFGGGTRREGFFEFSLGYITWCYGHLLELVDPGDYHEGWAQWSWDSLPMVPRDLRFSYRVVAGKDRGKGARTQLRVIEKLLAQSDYLVNATDAGREGELIFWEAAKYAGWGKTLPAAVPGKLPAYRFWCNTMTRDGLVRAWETMKPVREYLPLARAAYARSEADWLLGMNLTRAVSLAFARRWKDENNTAHEVKLWSVGRVQTPVLALVVRRDRAVENFQSRPFWEIRAVFDGVKAPFEATVLVPAECARLEDGRDSAFAQQAQAQAVMDDLLAHKSAPWDVKEETKSVTENPPGLFSLTDLQRWCHQAYGWSAQRTLDAAQAAYESEKVLSYPRTTSGFLPEDSKAEMDAVFAQVLKGLGGALSKVSALLHRPSRSPRAGYVFDSKKVSDHYAIVPTGIVPRQSDSDVGLVWKAVVRRFLIAFCPGARAEATRRVLTRDKAAGPSRQAVATGKTYTDRGWLAVDELLQGVFSGREPEESATASKATLAACAKTSQVRSAKLHQGATSPPKPYDEASLLAAMENISRVDAQDEDWQELKSVLQGLGLGTPATRADIIETLLRRGYLERVNAPAGGKSSESEAQSSGGRKRRKQALRSTPAGRRLIASLESANLEYLTEPILTARWEKRLQDLADGADDSREAFLGELVDCLKKNVEILRSHSFGSSMKKDALELEVLCPKTGQPVKDHGLYYAFAGLEGVRLWKSVAKREMSADEYVPLVKNGRTEVLNGFVSRQGRQFSAALSVGEEGKIEFVFEGSAPASQKTPVEGVQCPKTGEPVRDCGKYYEIPGAAGVRFWKTMSGREMSAKEYVELVREGKVGPLSGFVSKAGKEFRAVVVLKDGNLAFDFSF